MLYSSGRMVKKKVVYKVHHLSMMWSPQIQEILTKKKELYFFKKTFVLAKVYLKRCLDLGHAIYLRNHHYVGIIT